MELDVQMRARLLRFWFTFRSRYTDVILYSECIIKKQALMC